MRKPHDNTYILSELHRYLINKGLSNQYVTEQLDLTRPTYKKYLECPEKFRIEQVVILADITNTEIEDILDKIV